MTGVVATVTADSLDFEDFKDAMSMDANTTIDLNGADLNFNGGLLMLDDSVQRVGIGTVSPASTLQVVGTVAATAFNGSGAGLTGITFTSFAADTIDFEAIGDTLALDATTTIDLNGSDLNFNGGLLMLDDSAQNIGIGTITPTSKLQVVGQVLATSFNGDGSAVTGVVATVVADSLDFEDFKDAMSMDANTTIDLNGSDLNFNGGLLMLDDSAQNVGIGDTTPDLKLDVTSAAAADGIAIDNTLADGDPILAFQLSSTSTFTMGIDDGDADKFKIGTSAIGTNTRMTIDSSGNVGIGNDAPATSLHVNGTVAFTPSGTTNVTAGGGITVTSALMRVQGSGGAVNITANPQIADGTDGQMIIIKGLSDTNTLTLDNGTGLSLSSGGGFTMGLKDTMTLIYDATDDEWVEVCRSNK